MTTVKFMLVDKLMCRDQKWSLSLFDTLDYCVFCAISIGSPPREE